MGIRLLFYIVFFKTGCEGCNEVSVCLCIPGRTSCVKLDADFTSPGFGYNKVDMRMSGKMGETQTMIAGPRDWPGDGKLKNNVWRLLELVKQRCRYRREKNTCGCGQESNCMPWKRHHAQSEAQSPPGFGQGWWHNTWSLWWVYRRADQNRDACSAAPFASKSSLGRLLQDFAVEIDLKPAEGCSGHGSALGRQRVRVEPELGCVTGHTMDATPWCDAWHGWLMAIGVSPSTHLSIAICMAGTDTPGMGTGQSMTRRAGVSGVYLAVKCGTILWDGQCEQRKAL